MKIEIGKTLKSRTVYEITFQRCTSCYVDKNPPSSTRSSDTIVRAVHLTVLVRFKKNARPSMPVEKRHRLCDLGCVMPQQNLKIKTLVSTNEFLVSSLTRNSLMQCLTRVFATALNIFQMKHGLKKSKNTYTNIRNYISNITP